jgi:hypothetical protein
MKYADMIDLPQVLADIREFAREDPLFWQPSPLLVDPVERGADFDSFSHSRRNHAMREAVPVNGVAISIGLLESN